MPDFDPNKYLKKQSQSKGFDPNKYLEENTIEKKNLVQSVSPTGTQTSKRGSLPFQSQVDTKAPSVLLSDAQKQQREQERIGKRFETTLLNIPTEFGRVTPFMKAGEKIQETLPEVPSFRKYGEIPRMQPTAMTEDQRLGESLTEVTDFQELTTDKFVEKKTGLQKQIENAENAFRAYQGDELANQVQSYIPPEETLKIKQELGFDEKMSNVGSNFVNRLERFAPNTALAVGQTLTTLLGEDYGGEAYRMITGGVGNAEIHRMEAFDKLAKLDAEYKYSKGLIQSVQDLDLGGVAAGITDAVGSLVSTIITSAPTAGLGLYSDMVGSGLYDYNSAKANRLGITVDELYDSSQNEFFVPAILGGVGAQLEKIGLKGIKTAIMSNMAKGAGQKFALIGHNMNKEGVTELLQTGLEEVSNTLAQGKSVAEATLEFGKTLFSKKGAESYLMGVVASGSAIGGGRILKGLFSDKSKKQATTAIQAIEQQQTELSNPDLSEESRTFIYENIKNNVAELVDAVDSDVNETEGLSEDQKREVNNLNTKIQAFQVVINDPAASEETKNRAAKVSEETQAKIDDIINKKPPIVPPATGGAMMEAEPQGIAQEGIQKEVGSVGVGGDVKSINKTREEELRKNVYTYNYNIERLSLGDDMAILRDNAKEDLKDQRKPLQRVVDMYEKDLSEMDKKEELYDHTKQNLEYWKGELKKWDDINTKYDEKIKAVEQSLKETPKAESLSPTTQAKPKVEADNVSGKVSDSALKDVETKQQIENFGVPKEDVEATHGLLNQVFSGLKKAGLTAAKTVGDWVGIGKGEEKPYSLKIDGKDVKVKPTSPDVVNGFYSPLEKIITDSKFDKLPAKQWVEKYANSEEAKWTGLKDWLAQQQGSVSKADIQQFLKDNRIQVVEVVKGAEGSFDDGFYIEDKGDTVYVQARNSDMGDEAAYEIREEDGSWYITDNFEGEDFPEANSKEDALYDIKRRYNDSKNKAEVNTKFSQYQLEGQKENYKEVLVTMPNKVSTGADLSKVKEVNSPKGKYLYDSSYFDSIEEIKDYDKNRREEEPTKFKSSHFSEPNILVHLRMNTRVDAEGKKVLFLEEIQSDWGQKGKKEGFKLTEKEAGESWNIADKKYADFMKRMESKYGSEWESEMEKSEVEEETKLLDARENTKGGTIPQAPFVTDTNAWTKLALKTALKEAVKQGADKLAWTTGEQQNDRYDLSKQINAASASKNNDGTYQLIVEDKQGQEIEPYSRSGKKVTPQEMEGIVGKDLTQKLIEGADRNKGREWKKNMKENPEFHTVRGVDLKIGGRGMKGFYGSPTEGSLGIVGNVAKSLFKQEPKTVEIPEGKGIVGKPTVEQLAKAKQLALDAKDESSAKFLQDQIDKINAGKEYSYALFNSNEPASFFFDKVREPSIYTQHSIDITPELKASVEGGQPLFKKIENIKSISNTANLKSSEFYQEAKAGGNEAAKNLVNDILTDRHIEAIKERLKGVKNAIIAPVYGIEVSGRNAIPNALAWKIRQITGFDVDADISQSVKANHTNATREQRFLRVPEFEGDVQKGKNYILVDDVSASGSTLKAMKDYIEQKGGNVSDVIVIALGRTGGRFEPTSFEKQEIIRKFGKSNLETLLNETGRSINNLTKKELDFLKSFDSVDRARKALLKADQSRGESLLQREYAITATDALRKEEGGQVEAQYRIESGKNIIEAIKDFNQSKNKARATVALTHEIMHPTVVSIIDGAKEGNEVGAKHTETIVNEFNKANPNNKVTVEDLIKGNDAFKDGTTSKQYRQVQEFIAKAWEKYHTEGGKGFSEAFQKVLDQITKAFQSVYKSITGKQLTPELKQMFDDILGKEQSLFPTTQAKQKVEVGNSNPALKETKYPHTIYKGDVSELKTDGDGVSFFTRDKDGAEYYTTSREQQGVSKGNKTFEGNIVTKNPLIVDANKPSPIELKGKDGNVIGIFGQGDYIQKVKDAGYDAIVVNRKFGTPLDGWEIVSFDRKQIIPKAVEQSPAQQVEQLRAAEQTELNAAIPNAEQYLTDGKVDRVKITDAKDLKKFDKIYDKYDKLITPLLPKKETKAEPTQAKPKATKLKSKVDTRLKFQEVSDLSTKINEAVKGSAKRKRLINDRNLLLEKFPVIKYIDDNIQNITKQLIQKGTITKDKDKVTYNGVNYSSDEFSSLLHDGLLDQLVKDKIIDDSDFVKKAEAVTKTEFDTEEEAELYDISKETDPNVIAAKFNDLPTSEETNFLESQINDFLGSKGKINERDWREYDDSNNLTPEIRKRYIDSTNKSEGLDGQSEELADNLGMKVEPSDFINFVLDYGSQKGFKEKLKSNIQQALEERYFDLTGKRNITKAAAKKGFDAVNAKNKADKERKPTQKESLEEIGVTEEDINQYEKFAEQGFGEAETPLEQREFIRNEKIRALKKKAENAENDLLSFVSKSRGELGVGANVAEFAAKLAKVLKTYAELGIVTLEGVIDRLIEKAGKDFVNENIDAITDAFNKFDLQKENINEKAKDLLAEHKELVKKAKQALDNKIKNVDDFAEYLDENKTSEIEDAWKEANDRGKKTSSDFKNDAEKLLAQEEKERLAGKSKRMTTQRLLASDEYRDEFKQAIGEDAIYYTELPNEITEQEAQAIIDIKGDVNAEMAIMDMNNNMKLAIRFKIAQKLIDNYEAEGNLDKAVEIYENIAEKITDAAQGLQSLSTWPKLSPAAAIHMARKNVKKQYDAKAADAKPKTDKIDKDFKKINKESIEEALENIKKIVEKNSFPSGGAIITELPAGYGQNNKVFTREKYLAAKKSLRGYTLSFAGAVPMEKFIVIAGYHIEATGKDFNKFTRRMKADLGNKIKPYLKDIYAKTREQLIDSGYDKNLFLSDEEVNTQILEQEGKVFEEKLKKAIDKKDEKAQKVAIAKLQEISKEDGLWGQYKQSAVNRLRNVVLTNIQKDISESAPLEQFTDGLVKNMRAKMAELLPEVTKEKVIQRPDIEVIGDAFKNLEKYKEVWEQTQNEFQEKYQDFPEILESIDAYFGEILDKPFNDKMLSRAISKGLREMGTTISDIVTKHYTVVDNTKQSLADKLVNDAGLSGTEAEALSKAVQKEFDNIATKKKSQILEKMFSKKERKKTEFRTLEQGLIRLTNLGAFRNDNIVQMYGDKMGWPKLTEENVKELERLATIVQKTEDPIKKRKAVEDLLAYQANIKGTSIMEFVTAVWYANILSGYNTQAVNFGANALNTALLFGNLVAQNPKNVKFISKGLIEGIKRGFLEGKEVLRTGYSPIKGKAEIPTLLERKYFSKSVSNLPKPILKLVNYASYLKYVRRLMVAADVIFFEGQKEMRAYQQAMKQASLENKENPSLNQFDRAIELVGKSDIQLQNIQEKVELEFDKELDEINNSNLSNKEKEAAIKQAEIDKKRRTFDLIEQNRSSDMIRESVDFAAQGTYNYPPQGALGAVAGGINYMVRYLPVVRYAVPFTNIIANVANETLNYTPAAFFMLKKGGIVPYKLSPLTEQQRTDLLYKGIIGTTLMSTVFLLTQLKGDDDEPILEITANGTGDYAKNYALQETGWQPYSVRFKLPNGEYTGWMSYQYSPLVAALGYVGNINDLMKYTDVDEETIISLMTTSAGMTTASFFQGTFLTGLDDFASAVLDPRSVGRGQQVMEKILNAGVNAARAVLIPNLFSQVSQSVQKITNDYKKETRETIIGKFLQDVPYARDIYFNKINILGDPISPDTDKFYSANKPNKVIDLLIEKKKVFGAINRKVEQIYDITLGKQRALTDEEFFEYSKEKGQFIKNALLKDYDKFSKMTSSEFGKELAVIKKKATESARYEISDMGSDLTEIVRYIGGEPKTFELAPENVAQAVKIASEYKNTPAMVALRKQQIEAYVKVGKLSKQEAEKKASMQINRNANKYAKNMIWLKHIEAKKPQDVLEPK